MILVESVMFHAVKSQTEHLNLKLVYACKQHPQRAITLEQVRKIDKHTCRPGLWAHSDLDRTDLLAQKNYTMHKCMSVEIGI